VTLCEGGVQKIFDIHYVVAVVFIGSRPSKEHQINHKDLNKSNNDRFNLEWVTRSENSIHFQRATGWVSPFAGLPPRRGEDHPMHKLTVEQVREIRRRLLEPGVVGLRIALEFGIKKTTLYSIKNRKTWKDVYV
jgi:hypothetical protein